MDRQRYGERGGDDLRRLGGRRRLALALTLALALGCNGTRSLLAPDGGNGGRSGGSGDPTALLGGWETTFLVTVPGDIQLWTTRWDFLSGGVCHFLQTSQSVLDGITIVDDLDCTWSSGNGMLSIVLEDGRTFSSAFSFPGGDTSRLIFEGVEYQRVAT